MRRSKAQPGFLNRALEHRLVPRDVNKVDLLPPGQGASLAELHGAVAVSALKRTGLRDLLERAEEELSREEGSAARVPLVEPLAEDGRWK